jgi:hypothetical protein
MKDRVIDISNWTDTVEIVTQDLYTAQSTPQAANNARGDHRKSIPKSFLPQITPRFHHALIYCMYRANESQTAF